MKTTQILRPFADVDSDTECECCGERLAGKQVVRVPVEMPDEVFCSLLCATEYCIDENDVAALRDEAGEAGDEKMVALCERALCNDPRRDAQEAWEECVAVIVRARS